MPSQRKNIERFASHPLVKEVTLKLRYKSYPKGNHNEPNRKGKNTKRRRKITTVKGG